MFYLGGKEFPSEPKGLAEAIQSGLASLLSMPSADAVKADGASLKSIQRLAIDLSGASIKTDSPPPAPAGGGNAKPGANVSDLSIVAKPLKVEGASVDLSLSASNARFDFDRDDKDRPLLLLADAKNGHLAVTILRKELEALVLAGAKASAAKQGVQIIETQLSLSQSDSRSVSVEARVKAKKMFVTAVVTIRGKAAVDDSLSATLSGLTCSGEGMLGSMASGVIQPHLDKYNNRSFPLTALALGSVRLRDVQLHVGDQIKATAEFGS